MRAGFLVLALTLSATAAAADDRWIEVKSPHFTVVSNAGDNRARNIAWQFEQIRGAIAAGWPWARVQLDRPVMVVAAKDEVTMKLLLPKYWESGDRDSRPASVFASSPERHYITMRSDVQADDREGINPYFTSYWAYSMIALDAAFERQLPLWFRSGLAEVLSNSIVRDNAIQFGRAIPWHLAALQQGRVRLSELIEVTDDSPYYRNSATRSQFDAQCWGVMHYMLFGRPEDKADRVNQLAKLLLNGASSADAIQQTFGSADALETAYLQYERKPITQFLQLKVEANASSKSFPTRPLVAAEAAIVRAAVHAATGRPAEARAQLAEARKSAPETAGSYDVEAILLDREGKRDDARTAFRKAVDLKSESFYTQYRLGSLDFRSNPDPDTRNAIEQLLRRSVALNDAYPPSLALLADIIALGPKPADAVEPGLKAIALDPSSTSVRLAYARVMWRMSRRDDAKAAALAGRALSRNAEQRSQAEELLAFFNRAPAN